MSDFKPLGPPIRQKPAEAPERWVAKDPSKPHIQTNTKTGAMRSYDPVRELASAPPVWQYFGIVPHP